MYFDVVALRAKIILCPKSSKFIAQANGFPGKFKTIVFPILLRVVGLPGLIATLLKRTSQLNDAKASFVKSASPTLTPPLVMIRSESKALLICSCKLWSESAAVPIQSTSHPNSKARAVSVGVFVL